MQQITVDEIQQFVRQHHDPRDTILSVAGKIDWAQLKDWAEELFGAWDPLESCPVAASPPQRGYEHVKHESSQTHLAIAFPAVPYRDPLYYHARGAIGVLSDGMSSRLFTEVRQKRGLCYTVYASYHSLRDEGAVFCYSGTSSESAQETLDVIMVELQRLTQGIDEYELQLLKTRVKNALIMQQESSATRAMSMAGDWYHRGEVQSLERVARTIENLTVDSINAFLKEHPPADFSVATVGPHALEVQL